MKNLLAACIAVAVLALLLGLAVYYSLPPMVPVHWNAAGEVDAYGPGWQAAFMMPAVMIFVLLLFIIIPKIEVFPENLAAFEKQYWQLCLAIELFFLLFFLIILASGLGFELNFPQMLLLPLALLFIATGILMPSFKRNFFVGIRTPWTLANDTVWKKTHIFGGKLFIAAGLITVLAALGGGQTEYGSRWPQSLLQQALQ